MIVARPETMGSAMDRLQQLRIFTRVVEAGGFTAAAEKLGLSRALVSKGVIELERTLGVRLLERTTRQVRPNEAGLAYAEKAARLLAELEEADLAVRALNDDPRGTLKLNAPLSFGMLHLKPVISAYLDSYPQVSLTVDLTDRFVDLIEEGYDLAIRIGKLPDSSLVARRLAPARIVLCAAPDYLARRGLPTKPEELAAHDCLIYGTQLREEWHLVGPAGEQRVRVAGRLASSNGDLLACAAADGLGIAMLPTFIVGAHLQTGTLQRILPDWSPPERAIYAIYPPNRHLAAKVRLFIDSAVAHFGARPQWDLVE
jgi:DNA-binding transcriptional LysR family regulator